MNTSIFMSDSNNQSLLDALLDSWDRNNTVLINLLHALPEGGLEKRATDGSPTVSEMFTHMHHERMVSVSEEVPELCPKVPEKEWVFETNRDRIAAMLHESADFVREAVSKRVEAGLGMDLNYAHPIHLIQLLIFHEGYHHGQIKLALKIAGCPITDQVAGPLTWQVWRAKN